MQLLCRNDVTDFDTWKQEFDDDAEGQRNAGLTLLQIWRDADDRNRVFFLFDVNVREKAEAFIEAPDAALRANRAGVREGTAYFIETLISG